MNDLINSDLGPLVEDRSKFAQNRERYFQEGREGGAKRKWPEEKLPIQLESMRNFNVRAKVVGPGVSTATFMGRRGLMAELDVLMHYRECL